VRFSALLFVVLALAGCGSGGGSEFGDVKLRLPAKPSANDLGAYFASARGYDEAEGVTLQLQRRGRADFRVLAQPSRNCVAVMAIVRPAKLVLCVDPFILHDQRAEVVAVVRALSRGYTQAQLEPDEAVAAMAQLVPKLSATRLSAEMDRAAATWTEGAPYFGQLAPGPFRDPSVAADARKDY
jgi:ABC-type nitrate/sulfonate/bicarbonate transport system substrate-binding protein